MPAAIMGTEAMRAMKFRTAVMLLLTPMASKKEKRSRAGESEVETRKICVLVFLGFFISCMWTVK